MLDNILNNYRIILASKSPRRQQLLKELIPSFDVEVREIDEVYPDNLKNEAIAMYLSELKSRAFESLNDNDLIITSDTIVCLEDKTLGKPENRQDAINMLKFMSGKTHTVFTGVTIKTNQKVHTFFDATHVTFYPLSDAEIEHYIDKCNPFDKAGSYGIQEWIGYVGIQKMNGEFYNVMGLPLHRLYRELKNF